jgi:hypothetical protein
LVHLFHIGFSLLSNDSLVSIKDSVHLSHLVSKLFRRHLGGHAIKLGIVRDFDLGHGLVVLINQSLLFRLFL